MYRILIVIYLLSTCRQHWRSTGKCLTEERMNKDLCEPEWGCECKRLDGESEDFLSVNCANSEVPFDRVPSNIPKETAELILSHKTISNLNSTDFMNCVNLRKLNLFQNIISFIESETFLHTPNLTELNLKSNKLKITQSSSLAFVEYLGNIQVLDIHGNVFIDDNLFLNLTKLKVLSLDRLDKSGSVSFGDQFLNLRLLDELRVFGNFTRLGNDSFKTFSKSNLSVISIKSKDTLRNIDQFTFTPLRRLTVLNLGENRGLGLHGACSGLIGLYGTKLDVLILSDLTGVSDAPPSLNYEIYQMLRGFNLVSLDLSWNQIIQVEQGFGRALPYLQNISLKHNRVMNDETLLGEIFLMKNLEYVDFSYQTLTFKESSSAIETSFADLEETGSNPDQHQDLTPHKDRMMEGVVWKPCQFPCKLKTNSSYVGLDCSYSGYSQRESWCIPAGSRLRSFDLTASLFVDTLCQVVFLGNLSSFSKMIFRSNDVKDFSGPIVIAYPSKTVQIKIDISDNGASSFSPDILKLSIERGANISHLKANRNNFGNQFIADYNSTMFRQYKELIELSLAWNNIKTIYKDAFKNLSKLRRLNLSSNSLTMIEFEFSHMKQLRELDLSYNLLTYFNDSVIDTLKILMENMNTTLYLKGNPIQCNCQTLNFLKFMVWMRDFHRAVPHMNTIYCIYHGSSVTFDKLDNILIPSLVYECSSELLVIVSGCLLGVVLFLLMISVSLYRHRWDIRYFLISFRNKKHAFQRLQDQMNDYIYDAFVSYDHHDRSWVVEELMPNLESVTGTQTTSSSVNRNTAFNFCIHDRDFAAGDEIQENIIRSLKESRKVLLVLSKHFLQSNWCRFELEMGHIQGFQRGWNILVPIMLTPLDLDDMPATLQMLIRKKTYITWKNESPDREEFWVRLRAALLDTTDRPCVCECGRSVHELNLPTES